MNDSQRIGGIAALLLAATFVVGFALYGGLLAGSAFESSDPVEVVGFLAEHQSLLVVWHMIIYVLFGVALVLLAASLHQRLKGASPEVSAVAGIFGLIWAGLVIASGMIAVVGIRTVVDLHEADPTQAGTVWSAISAVQFGIGGGVELVGGLWALLIGWASLRAGMFSRWANYLAMVIGISGLLTVFPPLELFGAVFGLGLIVWWIWLGITLLRRSYPIHVPIAAAQRDPNLA